MSSLEESLQYPPSPSSTTSDHPIPDAASLSRPTLYELLVEKNARGSHSVAAEATTGSSSNFSSTPTETITRVNPLDESGFVSNPAAKNGLGAGPSASSSYPSDRSIYPSSSSIAGGNAPALYAASSRHSSTGASVTRADSVLSYIESPVSLGTSHAAVSARPESNEDRSHVPSQPHSSATPSASPSDLVIIISQVAIERADWNELKAMTERFQEEHAEYMRRNEEAVLALQREKEQLTKVLATVTSAFAKLDPLRVKQEKRFDAEQQKAERAFARRLSEEKRREEAAELERREAEAAESRKLAAERARQAELEEAARLAREEEDKSRAAAEEKRRKATEEAKREAVAEEERLRAAAAAAKRAEDDRRSAQESAKRAQPEEAERRQLLDEQRKTDNLKQELAIAKAKEEQLAASERAAKAADDARRLAEYEAQKAAVQEMKRKATEANADQAESRTTHIDPMTNVGPWTGVPRTPEEDELRDYARTPPIDDLPGRPAYDHYSPTPPPYAAPARREYDHYSPTPNRPVRSREKSPAPGRKRVRDYDPVLGSNEEPLVRRARYSPPHDYPEYGGTTPPRGRSPIPPYQRTHNARTPSPDADQYRNDSYRRGYAESPPQIIPTIAAALYPAHRRLPKLHVIQSTEIVNKRPRIPQVPSVSQMMGNSQRYCGGSVTPPNRAVVHPLGVIEVPMSAGVRRSVVVVLHPREGREVVVHLPGVDPGNSGL
ncbi:hypothetical protein IEO21_01508 [Rhodonia placenta]|uniref:Uncharacterized protein n=1 Tax=Rhodonia placenta TaxID=104341 RepID=A0A8H7U635_9APHY|nr:hypothetical protein IEO21_01508 [Postia placenta]